MSRDEKKAGKPKRDALERADHLNGNLMLSKRQCPAMSKRTGKRCKNYCGLGLRTCRFHGSGTRMSKTAAAKRIAQASGYAAEMLVEFMADPKVDMKTRTQIAQDLLNRAGVSGKQLIEVEEPHWARVLREITIETEPEILYDAILPGDNFDAKVIDAEVVEDDDADRDNEIAEHHVARAVAKRENRVPPQRRAEHVIPPSDSQEARDLYEARKKQQRLLRETDGRSRNGRATMRRK